MLWLDSAYPLDKPATDPGVQRGDCVGGESSTPTYLRQTYPNGYVSFKNAAVGEIGSTLLPANPTAPSPSAPSPTSPGGGDGCGCGPANGMNQPECTGKSETQCNHMVNYEGKCKWTVCNPPTQAPITPTKAPTKPPTKAPTGFPDGCYSINNKDCIHPAFDSSSCTKTWLPNGARNDCVALGGECTTSTCCEPAECVGDSSYASCLPLSETTSEPTKAPTEASPSSPPSSSCTICDDDPTNGMKKKGKTCTDINLKNKCNKNASWIKKGYCQLSCYNEGLGYEGDVCCTDTS